MRKLILALALLLAPACRASMEAEAGPQTPVFGGSHVKIEVDGRRVAVPANASLPAGTCVELSFLDNQGQPCGSTTVTAGGAGATIPPGAVSVLVSACDDPKPQQPNQADRLVYGEGPYWAYRQLPIAFTENRLRYSEFLVQAADHKEAHDLALAYVGSIFRKAHPKEVQQYGFLDVKLRADGDFQVVTVADHKPQRFGLWFDGIKMANLRQAATFHGNGWWAVSVVVPASMLKHDANVVYYKLDDVELTFELDG